MIVRTLRGAKPFRLFRQSTSREIVCPKDKVGHTIYDTNVEAGCCDGLERTAASGFSVQAHYCVDGFGTAKVGGFEYEISAGTLVAAAHLDREDR